MDTVCFSLKCPLLALNVRAWCWLTGRSVVWGSPAAHRAYAAALRSWRGCKGAGPAA